MTDPKRLLLEDGSEEERQLLQAGAAEQPPADGAARLALALGVPLAPSAPTLPTGRAGRGLSKLLTTKPFLTATLFAGAGATIALTLTLRAPAPAPVPAPAKLTTSAPQAADQAASAPIADTAHPTHSLADEVARLDRARRALAAQNPDAALSTLDAYRTRHPQGTLAPEALRLRVEAWLAKGDLKRARELAREFLGAYPHSPHATTLRRIAERAEP